MIGKNRDRPLALPVKTDRDSREIIPWRPMRGPPGPAEAVHIDRALCDERDDGIGPGHRQLKGDGTMSVLVVGLSHRSAPVAVLEHAAISGDAVDKLLCDVFRAEHVAGTFVVSTCNRVEVYAEVSEFHAGVTAICELLARHCLLYTSDAADE